MELQDILDKHSGAKARIDAIKKKELTQYFEPKIKEIILKTASEPDFPQLLKVSLVGNWLKGLNSSQERPHLNPRCFEGLTELLDQMMSADYTPMLTVNIPPKGKTNEIQHQ